MEKLGGLTPPVPASKISSRKHQTEFEPRIDTNEHEFRVVIRVYSQPVRPSLLIKSCIAISRRRRIQRARWARKANQAGRPTSMEWRETRKTQPTQCNQNGVKYPHRSAQNIASTPP